MCRNAHMCGSQKSVTNVIPQVLVTFFIETGSLTWRSPIMLDFFSFSHIGQLFINTHIWTRERLYHFSEPQLRKALSLPWNEGIGFLTWLCPVLVSSIHATQDVITPYTHTQSKSQRGLSCHFCLHVFRTLFCPSSLLLASTLLHPSLAHGWAQLILYLDQM